MLVASLPNSKRDELTNLLASWKLRIYTPKDGKKMTLADSWKKSRWGRPEWIQIYRHIEEIIQLLEDEVHKSKVARSRLYYKQLTFY